MAMSEKLVRVLVVAGLGSCMFLTGCKTGIWPFRRKPKIDPAYQSATLPYQGFGPAGSEAGIPIARPGSGDWVSTDDPLPPREGAIVPIQDQRVSGIVVYFAYDRATVGTSERPKLETLANYMLQHPTYCAVVEGHCDERGSEEYNRGLGERRALSVRDYLTSLGVDATRVETVGYGEEQPAVPNAMSEAQHSRNRRAEFVIGVRR